LDLNWKQQYNSVILTFLYCPVLISMREAHKGFLKLTGIIDIVLHTLLDIVSFRDLKILEVRWCSTKCQPENRLSSRKSASIV